MSEKPPWFRGIHIGGKDRPPTENEQTHAVQPEQLTPDQREKLERLLYELDTFDPIENPLTSRFTSSKLYVEMVADIQAMTVDEIIAFLESDDTYTDVLYTHEVINQAEALLGKSPKDE